MKPTPTTDNPPKVGDTIVDLIGNVYQITNVVVDNAGSGGETFDDGPLLTSIKGPTDKDAVVNVVTQAQYDVLTDKSGLYVIQG